MSQNLTGYGNQRSLCFNGDEAEFELWEVKFVSYLRLQKLHAVLINEDGSFKDTSVALDDAGNAINIKIFAHMTQFLDGQPLKIVIRDAKNDGRKAMQTLRNHYLGCSKPRIVSMYCDLTSLKFSCNENITEYCLRAETTATRLKDAGENVSDSLLIAMLNKGLPDKFNSFSTFIMQQDIDKMSLSKFKSSLKDFNDNESARTEHHSEDNVMKMEDKSSHKSFASQAQTIICYQCKKEGHKRNVCPNRPKKWCRNCRKSSHNTNECRAKNKNYSSKSVNNVEDKAPYDFVFQVTNNFSNNSPNYLLDSGASGHIITDRSLFIDFDESFQAAQHTIELADASRKRGLAVGRGRAKIQLRSTNGELCNVILEDALCIPSYSQNILSVQSFTKKGAIVTFGPNSATIKAPNGVVFEVTQAGKLYYLNTVKSKNPVSKSLRDWHNVLGHCNNKDILLMESVVEGMKITDKTPFNCSTCIEGKMSQFRSYSPDQKAAKPLDLVFSDLAGPLCPQSIEGSKYAIVFVDSCTGVIFTYFLKNKSDATKATEKFIADISPYGSIGRLKTDNGSEYNCAQFKELMVKHKIRHEFTAPYSSHQVGGAERSWRTLFDMARCLLINSQLPKKLWNHAVRTAAYIRNRCYSDRLKCTPIEKFTGEKPNINNMHVFGATCFAYIQDKTKLDPRADKGRFIGYDPYSPAYMVYFADRNLIRRVRCVEFFDDEFHGEVLPNIPDLGANSINNPVANQAAASGNIPSSPCSNQVPKASPCTSPQSPALPRRSTREVKRPSHLNDYIMSDSNESSDENYLSASLVDYFYKVSDIPQSYEEAMQSTEADKWQVAMADEMASLSANKTFELVPRGDHKIIDGKWVYCKKLDHQNNYVHKARYVGKGYKQQFNVDYTESFSPTARMTSVRILTHLASQQNMVVHSVDFKSAYLNAPIDHEVFMNQPPGFEVKDNNGELLVYKLNKSLYGLKQSGRMWYNMLHGYLVDNGFVRSECENCVYTRLEDNTTKTVIIVFVDDLIISAANLATVEDVKHALTDKFAMKDFGQLTEFLGIQFEFNENYIKMHQAKYVEKILSRFDMMDCNSKPVPCDASTSKLGFIDSEPFENNRLYREMVGSLVYLATCTRCDLSYVVTKLSEHLENPTMAHFNLCKYVLKYLKGSIHKGLIYYRGSNHVDIVGFSDADWASSPDRKSLTGYCYQLSENNSYVSWKTRKQPTVALSSCESEFMAATSCIQEGLFLRQLLKDMCNHDSSITLNIDNMGTLDLSRNPVHHQRSKHISVRYFFIRQHVQDGDVILKHVSSQSNLADVFTKPISKNNLHKFMLG